MGEDDEIPDNPPGYGETIGGVVLFDPSDDVIEAACLAMHTDTLWKNWMKDWPGRIDHHRDRMRLAIRAAVKASCTSEPQP